MGALFSCKLHQCSARRQQQHHPHKMVAASFTNKPLNNYRFHHFNHFPLPRNGSGPKIMGGTVSVATVSLCGLHVRRPIQKATFHPLVPSSYFYVTRSSVLQAYGMSVLPLNLIKGTRSVAYERLENTEDIDDVEHQVEKLKSKVGFPPQGR